MTVLGLDGALGSFSAAIANGNTPAGTIELSDKQALEHGLAAVAEILEETGLAARAIDCIGVGIGPGGFTGVRIAISYAKSLAQGWRRPLVGISSFDALETQVEYAADRPLLSVVRGRTGVVSVRLRVHGHELRASGYVGDVLDRIEPGLGRERIQVLGDAEDVLAALGERGFDVQMLNRAVKPAALAVAYLASAREPAASFHEVRADYGELPAARVPGRL